MVYEVVGIFSSNQEALQREVKAFINMNSDNVSNLSIEGKYYLDANNKGIADSLTALDGYKMTKGQMLHQMAWREKVTMAFNHIPISKNLYIMMIVSCFCAYFVYTCLWVFSMKKEIYVRRICGGNRKEILSYMNLGVIKATCVSIIFSSITFLLLHKISAMILIAIAWNAICLYGVALLTTCIILYQSFRQPIYKMYH